jgi:hypothetical protein
MPGRLRVADKRRLLVLCHRTRTQGHKLRDGCHMIDLIQIKIKRSDYDRLVKFGVAGEPVHEAETRALDKAETC